MSEGPNASTALSAFLRGVERRAALFAQLQVGSAEAGDAALTTAMVGFRDAAARTPFGDWPRRFWSLLLAAPQLREPPRHEHWDGDFGVLGEIGTGPRAALLLRLVANVSEGDASGVLGVSRETYRLALRRALPRLPDGSPDETRFRVLADTVQLALRDTPPERLAELARLRDAALRGRIYTPRRESPPREASRPTGPRARWLWPAMIAVVVAMLAALAATFTDAVGQVDLDGEPHGIRIDTLPEAAAGGPRLEGDAALLIHPDFELLAGDELEGVARDPAFLSWLTAELEHGGVEPDIARPQRDEDADDTDEHALESADAR